MNLKFSFSWIGLVIFALPMLINIAYVVFPPQGKAQPPASASRWLEGVEQVSRIAYLLAVTLLVSREPASLRSPWFWLAAVFLVLYYAVWIRYFRGGREIELLRRPFLWVPMPLAVFPILYFLCAALWLRNLPAMLLMLLFGAAHLTVSCRAFRMKHGKKYVDSVSASDRVVPGVSLSWGQTGREKLDCLRFFTKNRGEER